jgi:hypothetical protein
MSVKLIVLKSGEQIIADVKELVDERDNIVSVVFENPYVVKFLTPELLLEGLSEENEEVQHKVSFSPWLPLSIDKKVPIRHDWILTVVDPIDWVKTSYEQKMNISTEGLKSEEVADIRKNVPIVEDFPDPVDTSEEVMNIWSNSVNSSEKFENIEVIREESDV